MHNYYRPLKTQEDRKRKRRKDVLSHVQYSVTYKS